MKPLSPWVIRNARPADLADLFRLAGWLDSYNLPADRRRLAALIADSERSFAGEAPSRAREKYLFVLEDLSTRRVVGSSQIVAQHGTPGLPHLFMDVFLERRTSRTLRRTVVHRCLKLGGTEQGPTELGGLVVLPSHRGRADKPGAALSYVRLLFIAARRRRFRKRLLAEYLPAFVKKGVSPFWNYLGAKFTGLDYSTADRLSIDNKEFILALFPSGTLYPELFPPEVVNYLGRVGDPSLPAASLLKRVGFGYCDQIEPFDGGPYYEADTDRVSLIRRARRLPWGAPETGGGARRLVLVDRGREVRAGWASGTDVRRGRLCLPSEESARLGLAPGDRVWATEDKTWK